MILVADAESLEHTLAELALAGRTISTEDLRAKEVQHYRDMLARGELLSEEAFRKKLGVSKRRLSALVGDGRVFALDVDGHNAFPAFLCDARLNLKRLWKVALILVPAPPVLRLDLLTRQCGALGDEVPLDLLGDDKAFRELLRFARAWAGEFSRTCIDVYDASSPVAPTIAEPLYSCAVEVDPRVPLWTRALKAIHSPGFRFPHEIPPAPATVLIMVERATAGKSGEDLEARLMCELAGRTLRLTVAIARADEPAAAHKLKLAAKHPSVTDLCDAVFSRLAKLT
ncbi:hypothetical protein [Caballeronia hypogeia]|uniref:hypothetical protein n=1 Tax=Caballeronia hypogeia TaxID=1777140 RepID=UPI0012FD5869|nr:hypothetical protein [Caballeronia hypogeia]